MASRLAHILNVTSSVIFTTDSRYSKSFIEKATKYVDIGTVTSNESHTQSSLSVLQIIYH